MIVILGCLEVNTKVSDTGMETTRSDECKEVLGDDGNANDVLAVI